MAGDPHPLCGSVGLLHRNFSGSEEECNPRCSPKRKYRTLQLSVPPIPDRVNRRRGENGIALDRKVPRLCKVNRYAYWMSRAGKRWHVPESGPPPVSRYGSATSETTKGRQTGLRCVAVFSRLRFAGSPPSPVKLWIRHTSRYFPKGQP